MPDVAHSLKHLAGGSSNDINNSNSNDNNNNFDSGCSFRESIKLTEHAPRPG